MKNNILTPVKWTGSKRTQAKRIIANFPNKIDFYIEPFLGSGAVMMELLTNHQDKLWHGTHVIASDVNPDLVEIWNLCKNKPDTISNFYRKEWLKRNTLNGVLKADDNSQTMQDHRNEHYYELRDKYNKHYMTGGEDAAMELMCLLAFDFNGLVRYGKHGFNASCMPVVPGIHPNTKEEIINNINKLMKKYNVDVRCISYNDIKSTETKGAVIYCDPPYKMFLNEKGKDGVYNAGDFNLDDFGYWCKNVECEKLLVSFDSGDVGRKYFPECMFDKITNDTGTSKFRRQMTKTREPKKSMKTSESLYIRN